MPAVVQQQLHVDPMPLHHLHRLQLRFQADQLVSLAMKNQHREAGKLRQFVDQRLDLDPAGDRDQAGEASALTQSEEARDIPSLAESEERDPLAADRMFPGNPVQQTVQVRNGECQRFEERLRNKGPRILESSSAFCRRFSNEANLGSLASSSLPTTLHRAGHDESSLHARKTQPSLVRYIR